MQSRTLRFLSHNPDKVAEVQEILSSLDIEVVALDAEIHEIQTKDTSRLVRDKVLKAFDICRRPLIVEHTGLQLDALNGFPGGLTQVFWDTLRAARFSELFGGPGTPPVTARTDVGYTDGREIRIFSGTVSGRIPSEPRGDQSFQWDCVFVPDGHEETFAEMGARKSSISMRRLALQKLVSHLRSST